MPFCVLIRVSWTESSLEKWLVPTYLQRLIEAEVTGGIQIDKNCR